MGDGTFYTSIEISASGLSAERLVMDVIANNLANVNTTRTPNGGAFKRQLVVFSQKIDEVAKQQAQVAGQDPSQVGNLNGVKATQIIDDPAPDKLVYDPTHPDADAQGYVHYPNIEVVKEMVDMMTAQRAYEANVSAIRESRAMGNAVLGLLKA
ncbi:MAG: flagellar basal body rod protein FlgC [Candidatus Eremiobacteraeota bacterium]|nr:flagellar basal body rod protein FlgC [Candidatus Eremiobacteraeota bacterium]